MPNFFPPPPAYPRGIDSDYSLFMVHNTSETRLRADNEPWADEVDIVPVAPGDTEIWPENGFATIEGELFYYDAVERDSHARINRFRRCARGLSGAAPRYNQAGTWVRGFVVAEHHNQLVDALMHVEDFVGINQDSRADTLDYRIRNLRETPVIFDDWGCVDINFAFVILENDPARGILARFEVQVAGTFSSYRLDFGDGTFTTSDQTGTHRYAFNGAINPVVTVTNDKCTIIQSPISRVDPDQPLEVSSIPDGLPGSTSIPGAGTDNPSAEPFQVTIPEIQDIPPFVAPPLVTSPPEVSLPPLILPCLDLSPFPGISIGPIYVGPISVPSFVSFSPFDMPSFVSFSPFDMPSVVSFSPIDLPSTITFGPAPSFTPISFGPSPSIAPIDIDIDINIDASDIPSCISLGCDGAVVTVDWGSPPTINMAFVSGLNAQSLRKRPSFDPELAKELGADYLALFEDEGGDASLQVEYEAVGIPSEIRILPPSFADIKVQHDLPVEILLKATDLPSEIKLVGGDHIPTSISVVHELPQEIRLVGIELPSMIRVEHDIPEVISVRMIDPIPSSILLDASQIPHTIQVIGVPETIELKAPESIRLVLDENVEVPLVYRQGPIDVKVELDMQKLLGTDENGENSCVMLVPCPRR